MITASDIRDMTPAEAWEALAQLASIQPLLIAKAQNGEGEDRLLTAKQAAELLHVNETWIYRRAHRLPFVKPDMKPLRCSFLKLQQYIREGGER